MGVRDRRRSQRGRVRRRVCASIIRRVGPKSIAERGRLWGKNWRRRSATTTPTTRSERELVIQSLEDGEREELQALAGDRSLGGDERRRLMDEVKER